METVRTNIYMDARRFAEKQMVVVTERDRGYGIIVLHFIVFYVVLYIMQYYTLTCTKEFRSFKNGL